MEKNPVIGRFAPTPSGPLHFGSLVTAIASYCHARSLKGQWLLRIEDIDTPRNVVGATDEILFALETFGFEWDGAVEYQSNQLEHYEQVLQSLSDRQLCYACECSRRTLRAAGCEHGPLGMIYPGFCREKSLPKKEHSIRLNTGGSGTVRYTDQVYGQVKFNIEQQSGDFKLRRSDGIFAYHLAVVIDDERQGINQIVRGADLLEATGLHLYLQQLLGYRIPEYSHIPLVRNTAGDKLSKQTGATAINCIDRHALIMKALATLRQPVDKAMTDASPAELLDAAVKNWDHRNIMKD
jgi:glutamyl-Q tRNA(Asp) synthetase